MSGSEHFDITILQKRWKITAAFYKICSEYLLRTHTGFGSFFPRSVLPANFFLAATSIIHGTFLYNSISLSLYYTFFFFNLTRNGHVPLLQTRIYKSLIFSGEYNLYGIAVYLRRQTHSHRKVHISNRQ